MKKTIAILLATLFYISFLKAQSITGNLNELSNQTIRLEGFNGLKTYPISMSTLDENGNFKLPYSTADYGVGYIVSSNSKPFFVMLSEENTELIGESLSLIETIKITKGKENQWFQQYTKEHPKREQALSAWEYLEHIYTQDALFARQVSPKKTIQKEKKRINNEETAILNSLPKESYLRWFLPMRKLVSSVSVIAHNRTEEIPATIAAFRTLDYTDTRLYKSGLYKDAIEGHFWLLQNSGKPLDTVLIEMQFSIDAMLVNLVKDETKLNEVTNFLFDLFETHSLFTASEYLALRVLNQTSCTIDSNLVRQLESYRAMKKGNTAPNIVFQQQSFLNGTKQNHSNSLYQIESPYTLVFFGASWCPKCTEEMPPLIQNYSKWKNLGVEVVYVSLDTDATTFEQAIKSYPFFAYCDYKKWESTPVKDYYVFGTPTFYLLNDKREIILRPNTILELDAWLDKSVQRKN